MHDPRVDANPHPRVPAGRPRRFVRSDLVILIGCAVGTVGAAVTRYAGAGAVWAFLLAAAAVALLAALVGRAVDQMGDRFGAGATGVLQSALGNLPELFIGFFSLRAGLVIVVQSALIGSILANLLLVLGLALLVGGLRHGRQRFDSERARNLCVLLMLATAALVLPTLAAYTHSPAAAHTRLLSDAAAVVLILVFALSLPAAMKRGHVGPAGAVSGAAAGAVSGAAGGTGTGDAGGTGTGDAATATRDSAAPGAGGTAGGSEPTRWPLWLAVGLLVVSSVAAAFVSDWFVAALAPAMRVMHISQAFAGLVVVAIAGNAVENVVGVQLAARNRADYAMSVIVNSPLQIALLLAPALVLLSLFTTTVFTLVFAPMLVVAVVLTVLIVSLIIFDGMSNWLEGATLIALYVIIAATFWWG